MQFLRIPASADTGASVAWINPDAASILASSGVGCDNASLPSYLLEAFAFTTAASGESRFLVDYYGSSGTTLYGGSGRAGVINSMQVKGIGRTPLTATGANWHHGHGRMLLEEALREAIYSELAHEEFPLGAVRTLAVIECSEEITDPAGNRHRTALLVRPFVARACHLERAFGYCAEESGFRRRFQLQDVNRVSAWISQLEFYSQERLDAFAESLGTQIAHAHVSHWFHGGWYSSVMALDGRLIDFGSSRRVIDWRCAPHETYGPCFGDELRFAGVTIRSLASHIKQYAHRVLELEQALGVMMRAYRAQVVTEIGRCALGESGGTSSSIDRLFDLYATSFQIAQRARSHERALAAEAELLERLSLNAWDQDKVRALVLSRAARAKSQSRETVQKRLTDLIERCTSEGGSGSVQRGVDELMTRLRNGEAHGAV